MYLATNESHSSLGRYYVHAINCQRTALGEAAVQKSQKTATAATSLRKTHHFYGGRRRTLEENHERHHVGEGEDEGVVVAMRKRRTNMYAIKFLSSIHPFAKRVKKVRGLELHWSTVSCSYCTYTNYRRH
jgi:hypothetical protein